MILAHFNFCDILYLRFIKQVYQYSGFTVFKNDIFRLSLFLAIFTIAEVHNFLLYLCVLLSMPLLSYNSNASTNPSNSN